MEERCANCNNHFEQFRPLIKDVIATHHFKKDMPDFDSSLILDSRHSSFTRLHKLEESIDGVHIFRAVMKKTHIVYAVDKKYRLILLRAFRNFKEYKKFLDDKKKIKELLDL